MEELFEAAKAGNVVQISKILYTDPQLALVKDDDERTPVFWAVSAGHTEAGSVLLKSTRSLPKFNIEDSDSAGWTLLHIASSIGDEAIVNFLLDLGADVNARTNAGQTPLHFAVSKGRISVARKLLSSGARVGARDSRNQSPLHRAAAVGSLPLVRLLIENKAAVNVTDAEGWTPLHHALAEGHGDVAVELIKSGADLEAQAQGKTPLQVAPDDSVRRFVTTEISKS